MIIICDNEDYTEAAQFYAKKLGIPDDTIIGIKLHENISVSGYCERHVESDIPVFLIGLETSVKESEKDPFSVLAHEMVHVKQYTRGELVDHGNYCSWKGVDYPEFENHSEEYFFSPWEIEAFGRTVGLYHLYLKEFSK